MSEIDYRGIVELDHADRPGSYVGVIVEQRPTDTYRRVIEVQLAVGQQQRALFLDESEAGELLDAIAGALRAITTPPGA
jgi:hypothetical protein